MRKEAADEIAKEEPKQPPPATAARSHIQQHQQQGQHKGLVSTGFPCFVGRSVQLMASLFSQLMSRVIACLSYLISYSEAFSSENIEGLKLSAKPTNQGNDVTEEKHAR
eukprot:6279582-Amphidinium_carterae.1